MTEVLDRIRGAMVGLKMPRALEALDHTVQKLEQGEITAIEAIDSLLSEEYSTRETRRIDVALRTSKLMPIKTLESFDFSFQPSLDRERIAALAQLDFIRRAEVVHFLGPPGTGKSHLATALGVAAVKAGMQVYRATLAELVEVLAKAERQGQLAEKIRFYARSSLLIVDEIGYLPITQGGANLFFQLVNARYEKGAMILTSNRGFAEWGDVFGDPVVATALLDRLLHHAVVVQIEAQAAWRKRFCAVATPRLILSLPGQIYRKMGTSVETQLVIADKIEAAADYKSLSASSLADALDVIGAEVPPRACPIEPNTSKARALQPISPSKPKAPLAPGGSQAAPNIAPTSSGFGSLTYTPLATHGVGSAASSRYNAQPAAQDRRARPAVRNSA